MIEEHYHIAENGVVHISSVYFDNYTLCGRRRPAWGVWPASPTHGRPCLVCDKAKTADDVYVELDRLRRDSRHEQPAD